MPSTVEQAKFEYSPLDKVFTEGLDKSDKKEGILKRLKNIEDKKEELLKAKNKTEKIKDMTHFVDEPLSLEAKDLIEEIRVIQKDVGYRKSNLEAVTILIMILVIKKHLKSYLKAFITKKYNR